MKNYNTIYPKKKEDLIGTYKRCFWCKKRMEITEDGIKHWGRKHANMESLEDIYSMRLMDIKFEKLEFKLWFGTDDINKIKDERKGE